MGSESINQDSKLKSRLGYILLSAGSAIGLGNIWRFPYVAYENGGGIFLFFYIILLIMFGVPVLCIETSLGRKGQCPPTEVYKRINPKTSKFFTWQGVSTFVSSLLITMYYTVVTAWIVVYFFKSLDGSFVGLDQGQVLEIYNDVLSNPLQMLFGSIFFVLLGFGICALGIQKGLEKVSKIIMLLLFILLIVLTVYSLTLPNAIDGLLMFIKPDFSKIQSAGDFFKILMAALSQCFYSMSIGMGVMLLLGSYQKRDHKVLGDSIQIAALDTIVAILGGVIIFCACSAYNIVPDEGPSLLFITMPQVFGHMKYGELWGALFFLFLSFAALSSLITIFENLITSGGTYIKKSRSIRCVIFAVLSIIIVIPCILGFNVLDMVNIGGKNIFNMADFAVSSIILPLGGFVMIIYACYDFGWGFDKFLIEANTGEGLKFPKWSKWYLKIVAPILIIVLFVFGLVGV